MQIRTVHKAGFCYNDRTIVKNSQLINEFRVLNEVFMLILALVSGVLLVAVLFYELTPPELMRLERIDLTIAYVFLAEFSVRFFVSRNKYSFLRKSWWEILAAIPITNNLTQALRLLRLLRIGRLLLHIGLIRKTKRLGDT